MDANDLFYFAYNASQPMNTNIIYRVVLIHRAGADSISGTVYTNGAPMSTLPGVYADAGLGGFQLDTLTVLSLHHPG